MKTVLELRDELKASREAAFEALENSAMLEASWHDAPAEGEGELGWSPYDVAQHMVYGEWFMIDGLARMCIELINADASRSMQLAADEAAVFWARLEREQKGALELPGPRETAAALRSIGEKLDPVLEFLTDADLAKTAIGPRGPRSIGERLQSAPNHTWEHVKQLQDIQG